MKCILVSNNAPRIGGMPAKMNGNVYEPFWSYNQPEKKKSYLSQKCYDTNMQVT